MAESPTGGKEGEAPPASPTGGTSTPPVEGQAAAPQPADGTTREGMIPRERFDEVNAKNAELEQRLTTLETERHAQPREGAAKTWSDVPEETLNTVVANPIKYQEHFAGAMAERDRRMETRILGKATQAMTLESLKTKEHEAFNASSPLGKEVQRIFAGGRSDAEYMQDAIELARFRMTQKPPSGVPPNALAANLTTALQTPPGGTATPSAPPPNWADMSSDEFSKRKEEILLGRGK